ncbi:MAG TPA: DNA replication/repair protein RecF [Streptosporangiaceae bacterium]|nr:DNA replication/repair protein RecF [Streptosporangiaceae bacterium]
MHLTRLALTDFRSYAAADVRLEPGVTVFTGFNGQGKTNLVEAASYVATFGSHRVAADAPLIRHGADRAIIRAAVRGGDRDSLVEIEVNPGRANRVRLNRAPVRPREALGVLRCVLFAPEDLAVVKGDPDQRRRYLDDLLVATRPRYAGIRSDYERVVRQRSALLKSARARGGGPPRGLEVWDEQLVSVGAQLTAGRLELVQAIRPLVAAAYSAVSGTASDTAIRYRPSFRPDEEPEPQPDKLAAALHDALAASRRAELERGVCLAGPHRDELELRIGDLPARGYASHGESWSMALALRLAAFEVLRAGGEDPVLILDDVFAELDAGRRGRLAGLVAGADQVLVTAAVSADVPAELAGRRFTVASGEVTEVAGP